MNRETRHQETPNTDKAINSIASRLEEPTNTIISKLDELIGITLDCKIQKSLSPELTLWTTTDVASYLHTSYKYTNEYIVSHPSFPTPIRISLKKGVTGRPRWYAGEVIKWVEKYRTH